MRDNKLDTNKNHPLTWEYITGFFDGEGCIFFAKRSSPTAKSKRYISMSITQCDKNNQCHILERIYEFLQQNGIRVRISPKYNKDCGRKVIACAARACEDWIKGMLPYLTVKKKKAIEALEFFEKEIKRPWLTPIQERQILELRKQKFGIKKIGKEIGIHHNTVKRVLVRNYAYNERYKPPGRPPK